MITTRALIASAMLCAVACKSKPKQVERDTAFDATPGGRPVVVATPDPAAKPAPDAAPAMVEPKVVVQPEEGDGMNLETMVASGDHLYWINGSMHGYADSRLGHLAAGGDPKVTEAHSLAVAADGDHVYLVRNDAVVRRPHAGGELENVVALSPAYSMTVADGVVYGVDWTTVPGKKGARSDRFEVWRGAKDEKPKKLYTSSERLDELAVHGGRLYMTSARKVQSMTLDGKDRKTIAVDDVVRFAADDAGVYVGSLRDGAHSTVFVSADSGTLEVVSPDHVMLAADADHLYAVSADAALVSIDKKTRQSTPLWRPEKGNHILQIARGSSALYLRMHPEAIVKLPLP
jgi:hypothetical protein